MKKGSSGNNLQHKNQKKTRKSKNALETMPQNPRPLDMDISEL